MEENNWALLPEHELLQATFNDNNEFVSFYTNAEDEIAHIAEQAALCDLSNAEIFLITGSDATSLVSMVFACKMPNVAQCTFTLAFTGEGGVLSEVLLLRTGINEFVVLDWSKEAEALFAWLNFVSKLKDKDESCVFTDVTVEHNENMFAPLVMLGKGSHKILSDYLDDKSELPQKSGVIKELTLDKLPVLTVCLPLSEHEGYLFFLPVNFARIYWRSFLSFKEIQPIGIRALQIALVKYSAYISLPNPKDIDSLKAHLDSFVKSGLVRKVTSYIGARALSQ